jgi:hypothetical protein
VFTRASAARHGSTCCAVRRRRRKTSTSAADDASPNAGPLSFQAAGSDGPWLPLSFQSVTSSLSCSACLCVRCILRLPYAASDDQEPGVMRPAAPDSASSPSEGMPDWPRSGEISPLFAFREPLRIARPKKLVVSSMKLMLAEVCLLPYETGDMGIWEQGTALAFAPLARHVFPRWFLQNL